MKKYFGTVVLESLIDPDKERELHILEREVSSNLGWHLLKVEVSEEEIEALSKEINHKKWYMHFWNGSNVIAVFKDRTFRFNYEDKASWEPAINYGWSLGIPKEQLDFPIE